MIFSCTTRYVGEFCEYTNPCHTSSGPRCQNGGTCTVSFSNGTPSFKCHCPIGFTASLCEIPENNACDSSPCQNAGTCTLKSLQDYVCSCAQGYTGKYSSYYIMCFLSKECIFYKKMRQFGVIFLLTSTNAMRFFFFSFFYVIFRKAMRKTKPMLVITLP